MMWVPSKFHLIVELIDFSAKPKVCQFVQLLVLTLICEDDCFKVDPNYFINKRDYNIIIILYNIS